MKLQDLGYSLAYLAANTVTGALGGVAAKGTAEFLGRTYWDFSNREAALFGGAVAIAAKGVSKVLKRFKYNELHNNDLPSYAVGGALVFGGSKALVALGFTATAISAPSITIITIGALACHLILKYTQVVYASDYTTKAKALSDAKIAFNTAEIANNTAHDAVTSTTRAREQLQTSIDKSKTNLQAGQGSQPIEKETQERLEQLTDAASKADLAFTQANDSFKQKETLLNNAKEAVKDAFVKAWKNSSL